MQMQNSEEANVLKSVYNKANKLVTKEDIIKLLKQGGIENKVPNDMDLWQQVFVHKSYCLNRKKNYMFDKLMKQVNGSANEQQEEMSSSSSSEEEEIDLENAFPLFNDSNERLEWLGDGIIQSITAKYLWRRFQNQDEGFLTKTRSKLVKTETLCKLAKSIGLDEYLIISRDVEKHFNGRDNSRILEDTFEAFIGVLSIDFGEEEGDALCKKFIINVIEYYIDIPELINRDTNYKDQLMRFYQKEFNGKFPVYNLVSEEGAITNRTYIMCVADPKGNKVGVGKGKSKKEAEQNAAKEALEHFGKL